MAYCKKFIVLFLILFILLFNFSSVFASEVENVSIDKIYDLAAPIESNYFVNYTGACVGYFDIDKDFIYDISNVSNATIRLMLADEFPSNNVTYTNLVNLSAGDTYSYLSNSDTKLYVCVNSYNSNIDFSQHLSVTRRPSDNFVNVVDNLTSAVGPSALWGVFGSGIDFVFIIVVVALGLFIIYKLIKGLSKGKSKI